MKHYKSITTNKDIDMKKKNFNDLFVPTYKRDGAPLVAGDGCTLRDSDGNTYLDFGTGIAVNAFGHAYPDLVKIIRQQGSALLHASNLYYMDTQIELARLLIRHSFAHKVFFCNSGTEAVEAAIKFARKAALKTDRKKYHVLSFTDGFHGRTYGALSATAQKKFHEGFGPMVPGFHYAPFNDIEATKKVLEKYSFAAIIVEPLQGEGGCNPATKAFLRFLKKESKKKRITLIFDEIQCGLGRTGTLWCHEQYGITPDIMTVAKPLGGGLPLGATLCTDRIASAIQPGDHGTTFGGNPLACALGTVILRTAAKKSTLARVQKKSAYLHSKLTLLQRQYPDRITEIRGKGLLLGARMSADPAPLISACKDSGLLVIKAGHNTVRFIPPFIVTRKEIDRATGLFRAVLDETQ
jgi:predicted acetylornithine/succinylornithine family transaminase